METFASSESKDQDFECSAVGSLWDKLGCIAGYSGNSLDVAINYTTLLLNIVYCAVLLHFSHRQQLSHERNISKFAIGSFVGVVIFQFSLCLLLGCSGVSIIWCAFGGWIMMERRRSASEQGNEDEVDATESSSSSEWVNHLLIAKIRDSGTTVLAVDLLVIVYYLVVAEPITTVAHVCALILGAVLCSMAYGGPGTEPHSSLLEETGISSSEQPLLSSADGTTNE